VAAVDVAAVAAVDVAAAVAAVDVAAAVINSS